jgi:hypothetical protein
MGSGFSTNNTDVNSLYQLPFTGSTNTTLTGFQVEGVPLEYVTLTGTAGTALANSGYTQNGVDISTILQPIAGENLYTAPGTYTWTCPNFVTNVCILTIGSGGGSRRNIGATAYVGTAGAASNVFDVGASNRLVCQGGGGGYGNINAAGAGGTASGFAGFVGFTGGAGGLPTGYNNGGGGGAAGYAGNGGRGGFGATAPVAGAGGGGGGGGGNGGGLFAFSAGGVGVYGQGSNGAAGVNAGNTTTGPGKGGSGGLNGSTGTSNVSGGNYGAGAFTYNGTTNSPYGGGGGAGLAYYNNYAVTPGNTYTVNVGTPGYLYNADSVIFASGGLGAVRILWGNGRSFPSTQVGTAFNQTVN